jgi:CBS domain-containing protein
VRDGVVLLEGIVEQWSIRGARQQQDLRTLGDPGTVDNVGWLAIRGAQMATNVRDVMILSIPTVSIEASLPEVAEILAKRSGSAVLVVAEDGEVVGIVTEAVLAGALSRIVEAVEAGQPVTERSLRPAS